MAATTTWALADVDYEALLNNYMSPKLTNNLIEIFMIKI